MELLRNSYISKFTLGWDMPILTSNLKIIQYTGRGLTSEYLISSDCQISCCSTIADKVKNFRHPSRLSLPPPDKLSYFNILFRPHPIFVTVTPKFCVNFLVLFILATCEITLTVSLGDGDGIWHSLGCVEMENTWVLLSPEGNTKQSTIRNKRVSRWWAVFLSIVFGPHWDMEIGGKTGGGGSQR